MILALKICRRYVEDMHFPNPFTNVSEYFIINVYTLTNAVIRIKGAMAIMSNSDFKFPIGKGSVKTKVLAEVSLAY